MSRCKDCRHWAPFFTGEHWGVRSLADAPEVDRQRVLQLSREREDKFDEPLWCEFRKGDPSYPDISPGYEWPLWGECRLTAMHGNGLADEERSLAIATDGSGYMAILRCNAEFGCVQWSALEPGVTP